MLNADATDNILRRCYKYRLLLQLGAALSMLQV